MKHIELQLTNELSLDLLESILREYFPDKKIKRQNRGWRSPFVHLRMSFWIRVCVKIIHKPAQGITYVYVWNTATRRGTFCAGFLSLAFRKNHRETVMNALRDGLLRYSRVVFLNR